MKSGKKFFFWLGLVDGKSEKRVTNLTFWKWKYDWMRNAYWCGFKEGHYVITGEKLIVNSEPVSHG